MNSESIDPETLAAFLDGTLQESDRERVLQALARGGAAYEDLIDVHALQQAGDIAVASPPVAAPAPSLGSRTAEQPRAASRRWRRPNMWVLPTFLTAASIATFVLLRGRDHASTASPTIGTMARVTAAANGVDPASAFGAGWDQANWSTARGSTGSLDDRVYAFRLGVRFVDFALAVSSSNSDARYTLGQAVSVLASSALAGTPVAARVDAITADSAMHPTAAELATLSEDVRALASQPDWFDAAVWSESARLAARARETAFFAHDSAPMRELRRIVARLNSGPSGGAAPNEIVESLRRLAEQHLSSPVDFNAIGPLLDSTVARGGR